MWRVLSGIVVGVLLIGGAVWWFDGTAGASPPVQSKPGTSGAVPQKAGADTRQGAPGGQGVAGGQGTPAGQARQTTGRIVNAVPVVEGRVKLTFTYTGTVQPRSQINVAPRTAGRLEQILVEVGSKVNQGDTIAVLDRGNLLLAVQQAEVSQKTAQARLATVLAGGRPEDVTAAEAALASARARLNQVRNGPTPADLQSALSAVDSARANLSVAEARLDAVKAGPTQAEWASARAAVESASADLKSAEARLSQLKAGPTTSELVAAQAAVNQAQVSLTSALDRYEMSQGGDLKSSGATSNSAAQQAHDAAKTSYDLAVQKLAQLQAGPTAADLQSAQSAYDKARATLEGATARVEQLKRAPTAQEIQQAQGAVDAAHANLASAETRLAQLQKGPTQDELAIVEAAVTQATQTLALKRQPYTAQDLQTAQAAVEGAGVALAIANAQLAEATLVAPFSGIVTQKLVVPGAVVSAQSPVATLASSELEVSVNVEESRLSRLKPGLAVTIVSSAYPGESFTGDVVSLAPTADTRSHTFAMKVVPNNSSGKLRPGMFAELRVTAEERVAPLVPRDAVIQRAGKDVVFVVAEGRARMREVVQGLPLDSKVEIVSGVQVGEQVVVVGHSGLMEGEAVRFAGDATGQQPEQQQRPQQQQPGAPGKSRP